LATDRVLTRKALDLGYGIELYDYDIFPKVVPSGKESTITIQPLGAHVAFTQSAYALLLCPLDEGKSANYPERKNNISLPVKPNAQGNITFTFTFFGEQEFLLRLCGENFYLELSVFTLFEDLVGRYPYKGDLHTHSVGSDGKQAAEIVAANMRKCGYDFIAVTDHFRYAPSLDAIAALKDCPTDMVVFPGEEVHLPGDGTPQHINAVHIINFGGDYSVNGLVADEEGNALPPERRARIPNPPPVLSRPAYYTAVDALAEEIDWPEDCPRGSERYTYASCKWIFDHIRRANGLGVLCHPYRLTYVLEVPPSLVDYMMETHPFDAFEVVGGKKDHEQNSWQVAQYHNDRARGRVYPVVGSSDSHSSVMNPYARCCHTLVFAPDCTRDAVVSSIKSYYSIAVDNGTNPAGTPGVPSYIGTLRFVRYATFLEKYYFPLHDELCFEEGRAMKDWLCGVPGAEEILRVLRGRTQTQRKKYFAF
jgi:hypothetical protein